MTPLRWGPVFLQRPPPIEQQQKMARMGLTTLAGAGRLPAMDGARPALKGSFWVGAEAVALGGLVVADVHFSHGQATLDFLVTAARLQRAQHQPVTEA